MRRVLPALGAALALLGVAAGSAGAAKTLTLETAAGPLMPGAAIVFSSNDLVLVSVQGNDECSKDVLTGTVEANSARKVAISFGEASFTGEEAEGVCKDTEPLGPAKWTTEELPWPLTLTPNGAGKLQGSPKITMVEEHPFDKGEKCVWQAAKLLATFAQTGTTPEPLTLTVTKQALKTDRKRSNPACQREDVANGHFTATSSGETVLART